MGGPEDLSYLCNQLNSKGGENIVVLKSKCNEQLKTVNGVAVGGKLLADEILSFINSISGQSGQALQYISIVGNSLGGLYARYAIKELFNELDGLIAGLRPRHFLVIIAYFSFIRSR